MSTTDKKSAPSNYEQRIAGLPVWRGPIHIETLKGGLSNDSFTVRDDAGKYVVRFGRDFPFHHVFRDREVMMATAAHAAGFAPEVVHHEPGVMVSRFIDGKTYEAGDVRDNLERIAAVVGDFHRRMAQHISGPGFMFWVFHVIRDYARTLRSGGSRMSDRLDDWLAIAERLEADQAPLPIVVGHHDFLPANFIDDGDKIWIIDFEYAGFSTPMFDLAGIASNAEFSAEQSQRLLQCYFGAPPDEALIRAMAAMQCASLLRETMWSLVSELYLDAAGVDYVAYTGENLDRLERALDVYSQRYGAL